MRHLQSPPSPASALSAAGTMAVAAGAAWYTLLMRGLWAAEAVGPICRHGPAALHCPGCYGALGLAVAGLAALAASSLRRPAPAAARPRA